MSEGHARLGPSNHRWPHCPGSVREEAAYPDISSESAIDGTGSHLLLELCLVNGVRAEVYDMQVIGANHKDQPNGWMVHPDRIERVQMCLDYISTRVKELRNEYPGCKVVVESESQANPGGMFGRDDWWGTCDITITVLNTHNRCMFMEVADYKDGRGWVNAENNTQLISYLAGKLRPYVTSGPDQCRPFTPEKVSSPCRMTIVQPKTNPVIRYQDMTAAQVIEEAVRLSHAARATDDPNAPLIPDNRGGKGHCQWCKHKPNCTALSERDLQKVMSMSTDVTSKEGVSLFDLASQSVGDVAAMSSDKLTELVDAEPGIMSIFDTARAEIQRRVETGERVRGWAMQPGRGSKVWAQDQEATITALKGKRLKIDEICPRSLASPAQILKSDSLNAEQKKNVEKDLIVFKAGADKLTRVSVEEPEVDTVLMFADVAPKTSPASEPVVDFTVETAEEETISFM